MVIIEGVGEDVKFSIYKDRNIMTEYLRIYKGEGIVTADNEVAIKGRITSRPGRVVIDETEYLSDIPQTKNQVGKNITFYYREEDGEYRILAVREKQNVVTVLSAKDVDGFDYLSGTYTVRDGERDVRFDVGSEYTVVYNGQLLDGGDPELMLSLIHIFMGKKGFIFVLIASMLVLCMPISALAAETVFQSDFAGGSLEKITSYINNPPAGGVEKPIFEIVQKDGVRQLVLDTAAYAGQPYPEKAVNNVSYQRVDITQGVITDEMAEETEYFYEVEVKFEKVFSFLRFGVRYGNAGWDAANPNAMRDENFLTVSNQGILRFGSWQKQLNLSLIHI